MSGKTARNARRAPVRPHPAPLVATPDAADPIAVSYFAPRSVTSLMTGDEIVLAAQSRREWERAQRQIDQRRLALVKDVRSRGMSWAGVGWLLGTTGEAARLRFGAS